MPSLHDFDMDENLIHKLNSDYYDIITFPKTMKTKDCFSLFHVNLRSLSAHIDEMQALLTALKLRFDVRDCSFEIREGAGRFGGRVIKFLTSFLGFFKIYNTRFGGLQIFLHKIVRI